MAIFDSKSFNPNAFKFKVGHVPNLKMAEIKKSRALAGNPDIKSAFSSQGGTGYATIVEKGLADGDALNYDGQTDITATRTKTFERGVVVVGRAKAWTEADFSYDITGGEDFDANIVTQVAEYLDNLDEDTILATLQGIFSMTGAKNLEFVNAHTTDVTAVGDGLMTATTLNTATAKACGANKKKFSLVFMHSAVSTNLENLNLLAHLKYTDANGIERELDLGTWNGKLVVISDSMPTEDVKAAGDVPAYTKYTTYALGDGSIDYEDIGARVPSEVDRNPAVNGGENTLYVRQRKVFSPRGISYTKASQATLSPTDAELANGANWEVVHSGESTAAQRSYFNHKAIAIARIISKG